MSRRVIAGWVAAAVAGGLVIAGGWALATRGDGDGIETIDMGSAGVVQDPNLGTNAPVQGDPLPDVTLRDTDGADVSLSSLAGTPLVVNFWYSGCQPCKQEMPELGRASDALAGRVTFVGVNTADRADRAAEFAADHGASYLQLLDPNGLLTTEVGVSVQPTTLFVSADGTIVKQQAGQLSEAALSDALGEAFGVTP